MSPATATEATFWNRVKRTEGCWLWTGSRNGKGYGSLVRQRKSYLAHRFAWNLVNGSVPDGMHVLHHCDNPPCVRPDHLFLGTHTDNMRDMSSKGRTGFRAYLGESNPNARLTNAAVADIRRLHADGWTQKKIADRFGVNRSTIGYVVRGEHWSGVA